MQNLLDPMTTDLLFTWLSTAGVLICATFTLLALPWTDVEIAATEAAADRLLQFQSSTAQIRSSH